MRRIGLAGGLVAAVVVTVLVLTPGDDFPPPTALFRSKHVGDGTPEGYVGRYCTCCADLARV